MNNGNNEDQNKIRRKKVSSSNNTNKPNNSSAENDSRTKSRNTNNKKDKFRFFRLTGVFILALLVVVAAVGTGLVFSSLKDVQPVTKALLDEKTYQTTKIYYANGDLLSNAPSINKKEPVSIDEMSPHLKNAIVAIEDERFYEHNGVDIVGLARSTVKTLLGQTQGGSTIPMQVSKMLLTSSEQTLPRKVKDIYYAYEMSKTLSKEEILEAYLNNFSVGRGLIGAEAGAQGYFSKKAINLELEEAALLAGSTKNPAAYRAYNADKLDGTETKEDLENKILLYTHTDDDDWDDSTNIDLNMLPKLESWGLIDSDTADQIRAGTLIIRKAVLNPKAKARQEVVLGKMLELGYITQEEYDEAVAAKIEIKLPKIEDPVASSVQDLIESEVVKALMDQGHTWDEADNLFRNGGLHIQTTIDPNMQDILEETYANNSNFPQTRDNGTGVIQPQSAMVILDYRTGQIKALVGGRHIKGRKTLNRATTAQQPGSTIKPLSVYTPAIDTLEITQATSLSDAMGGYKFNHRGWNPSTTTAGSGYMSLRKALAYSSNTIAVKTAEMLGDSYEECVDVMIDYLKNFGISTLKDSKAGDRNDGDRRFPALTLGGMTYGVSPLEMASAYGTLANGGIYIEPTIFSTIKTYDDHLLVKATPQENRVVSPEVAYVITDMLKAVVTEGIGGAASIGGKIDVAGKTGTTNGKLDAWFVGYTPYYVASTYIGDDAGRKDPNTQKIIPRQGVVGSSGSAAKLWSTVMKKVHANLTEAHFTPPDNIYFAKINLIDGGTSPTGSNAAFIDGTAPTRVSTQQIAKPPKEEEQVPEENPDNNDAPSDPPDNDNNNNGVVETPNPPNNTEGGTTTPPNNGSGGNTSPPNNNEGGTPNPPVEEPAQ